MTSEKLRDHEKPRIARLSAGNKAVEPRGEITEDHVGFGIISALKQAKDEENQSSISWDMTQNNIIIDV